MPSIVPTSPTSSSRDDSIKALWRSSSAANLTDVPELPTPSPERPSPRRMRSAPDILGLIKSSPPSPVTGTRPRPIGTTAKRFFAESPVRAPVTIDRSDSVVEGLHDISTDFDPVVRRRRLLGSPLFTTDREDPKPAVYLEEQASLEPLSLKDPNRHNDLMGMILPLSADIGPVDTVGIKRFITPTFPSEGLNSSEMKKKRRKVVSLRSRIRKALQT